MKKILLKVGKIAAYTLTGLFLTFVVYANLEPAPMHAYVKPIKMTIFKVEGLTNPALVNNTRERVSQLEGVTACAANPVSEMVSITFDPDQTSETSLHQMVKNITHLPVQTAVFESTEPSGPQCPVPQEYILAFEQVKYAFCIR